MISEDDAKALIPQLPEELEFVGGPYCGFYLHPRTECIHTVCKSSSVNQQPANFTPVDKDTVVLWGYAGPHLYVFNGNKWSYQGPAEPVDA